MFNSLPLSKLSASDIWRRDDRAKCKARNCSTLLDLYNTAAIEIEYNIVKDKIRFILKAQNPTVFVSTHPWTKATTTTSHRHRSTSTTTSTTAPSCPSSSCTATTPYDATSSTATTTTSASSSATATTASSHSVENKMCSQEQPVKAFQQTPLSLPLAEPLYSELIAETTEFAIAHGMVLRRNGVLNAVPFSLLPSPMPRPLFLLARSLTPAFQQLKHDLVQDTSYLKSILAE